MSNKPGHKRSGSSRKRPFRQAPAGSKHPSEQPQSPGSAQSATAHTPTRRTARKEAARAQAKKKQQLRILIGAIAAAVIVVATIVFINRPTSGGAEIDYSGLEISHSGIIAAQGTPSSDTEDGPVPFSTGATVGNPNAPVTMHIFSDFQCHFCKVFHDETLPLIVEDFVRSGEVKLVFHDFPRLGTDSAIADPNDLSVEMRDENNQSSQAAQAAMCAGEQDQYLEMGDHLFANYRGVQSGGYNRDNLDRYAGDIGLEMDAFRTCMDSERYVPALARSVEQGQAQGISGVPTFVLDNGNGELNVVQQTAEGYDLLKRQIEASIETAP